MFRIQLSDASGTDTGLAMNRLTPKLAPQAKAQRFLKSDRTVEELAAELGDTFGQALIAGDPEYTIGVSGKLIGTMQRVWLSNGEPRYVPPVELDIIKDRDGKETSRAEPRTVMANIASDSPLKWYGEPVDKMTVAREYVFRRTLQIRHKDGLTFDFCYGMAKQLFDARSMVRIRGGADGKQPLVLAKNGQPHWGFLEGRVLKGKYQLLLHLSYMTMRTK